MFGGRIGHNDSLVHHIFRMKIRIERIIDQGTEKQKKKEGSNEKWKQNSIYKSSIREHRHTKSIVFCPFKGNKK
jgi:hypothetical protein